MSPAEAGTRSFRVLATLGYTSGRPVFELADPDALEERYTLWPGLPPAQMPLHPGLAPMLLVGRQAGEPVWLEARPEGISGEVLSGRLAAPEVSLLLQDICEVLHALHEQGQVHGEVRANRMVVSLDGWVVLVGAGIRRVRPDEDLVDLIRLGRKLLDPRDPPGVLYLPETLPRSVLEYRDDLARRFEGLRPDDVRAGLVERIRDVSSPLPRQTTLLEVDLEVPEPRGIVDEVGVELGRESEGERSVTGWTGTPSWESTGSWEPSSSWERTGGTVTRVGVPTDNEVTGSFAAMPARSRRAQLLARILAPRPTPRDPAALEARTGTACKELERMVLEEPLDPLPTALDTRRTGATVLTLPSFPLPDTDRATETTVIVQRPVRSWLGVALGGLLLAALIIGLAIVALGLLLRGG